MFSVAREDETCSETCSTRQLRNFCPRATSSLASWNWHLLHTQHTIPGNAFLMKHTQKLQQILEALSTLGLFCICYIPKEILACFLIYSVWYNLVFSGSVYSGGVWSGGEIPCNTTQCYNERIANAVQCMSLLIVRSQWLPWIQIINYQNCNQFFKGHKSLKLSLSLSLSLPLHILLVRSHSAVC